MNIWIRLYYYYKFLSDSIYYDCANKFMFYSLSLQKYFKYQHTQKINWLWSYSYKLILFREFKVNCRLMITPHFLSNYLCTNSNNLLLPRRWQISVKLHVITCKEGSHCLNWPKHNNSFMNCIFFAKQINIQSQTICIKTIGIYHSCNNCYITLHYFIFRVWDGVWHINQVSEIMTKLFRSFYNSIHLTDSVHEFPVQA